MSSDPAFRPCLWLPGLWLPALCFLAGAAAAQTAPRGAAAAPGQSPPGNSPPGQSAPAQAPSGAPPANPYNFADWHADFPAAIELPQHSITVTYERSRRQALEQVVANLKGNVRREVWHMAMEFFGRAPDDAIEALIQAMARSFGQEAQKDV